MKTYMANPDKIERKWYVVDAEGATLGRLASEIAKVLRGKNKPDSFFMCRHRCLCNLFVKTCFLICKSSVNTNSLAKSFCKYCLCVRVDQLIFQ